MAAVGAEAQSRHSSVSGRVCSEMAVGGGSKRLHGDRVWGLATRNDKPPDKFEREQADGTGQAVGNRRGGGSSETRSWRGLRGER